MNKQFSFLLAIMLMLIFFGCKTISEEPVTDNEEPVIEQPQPEPEPVPEPTPEKEPVTEPEPEVDPAPIEEASDEFVVTPEVFEETFVNIEALIGELNGIIRAKNYFIWTTYLTREYKEYYSDPQKLLEMSQQPILKKYGIRLRSLQDYFEYVVVPSRSQAKLDDLIFTDNEHIEAIMLINGKRSILYSLEKIDGIWKIGV
ncbi:MAG: hypothetical protein JEY99_07540 [Spirochaetales bacterium]|nr:hypothetical protein [Spirochaetales bacterium]